MTTLKDSPTTLMFHAEMLPPSAAAAQQPDPPLQSSGEPSTYRTFLDSRPPAFETCAVEEILSLTHLAPQLHLHIVHLSATECIPILRQARDRGVNITAETCFHYLGLASDDIQDGDTRHKCCPPIRSRTNQDRLWDELGDADGCIKTIVSDHSPCTPELKLLPPHLQPVVHPESGSNAAVASTTPASSPAKESRGDFFAAWGGISSVGLGLPILYTAASERAARGESAPSIIDMVRMCSQATARQVGLGHRKGGIRAGMDADVCVFDDEDAWVLRAADMRWKNRCSPWEGHAFKGRVHATWVRGQQVFQLGGENAGFVGQRPVGEPIVEPRMA
jgi:allantoinase